MNARHLHGPCRPAFGRLGVATCVIALASVAPLAGGASANTIQTLSQSCAGIVADFPAGIGCTIDNHIGSTPQSSSSSRGVALVSPSGGANLGANTSAVAAPSSFAIFSFAGGLVTGSFESVGFGALSGSSVRYTDTLNIGGSGRGTLRVPWLVEGGIDISGSPAGAALGFTTCASNPTGTISVSFCARNRGDANGSEVFNSDTSYSELWILDFAIELGVDYDIVTQFGVSARGGGPDGGSSATADFAHTGRMQPVQVFDSLGNILLDPVIVAESGLDYLNPQGDTPAAVPEPDSLAALGLGLAVMIGLRGRRRPIC